MKKVLIIVGIILTTTNVQAQDCSKFRWGIGLDHSIIYDRGQNHSWEAWIVVDRFECGLYWDGRSNVDHAEEWVDYDITKPYSPPCSPGSYQRFTKKYWIPGQSGLGFSMGIALSEYFSLGVTFSLSYRDLNFTRKTVTHYNAIQEDWTDLTIGTEKWNRGFGIYLKGMYPISENISIVCATHFCTNEDKGIYIGVVVGEGLKSVPSKPLKELGPGLGIIGSIVGGILLTELLIAK